MIRLLFRSLCAAVSLAAAPAPAQEAGWRYSPANVWEDRKAEGCDRETTQSEYVCLTVRCEDDYSVGLHILALPDRSKRSIFEPLFLGTGKWMITIDREPPIAIEGGRFESPYGARVLGNVTAVIDGLKNGAMANLVSADGEMSVQFQLTGSLTAINRALFFCAPRTGE